MDDTQDAKALNPQAAIFQALGVGPVSSDLADALFALAKAAFVVGDTEDGKPCVCRHHAWLDPADYHEPACLALRNAIDQVAAAAAPGTTD